MPNATVTIRTLKNKNSGIDASIPDHREIPGLLGSTVEYHVVVVTILQCFKLPKHKDTDVVQFMIPKHLDDFEELRRKLIGNFPGVLFPPLPRKTFGLMDSTVKERRVLLDTFVKYVVGSLKTAACPALLQFLGASPLKAGSNRTGEKRGGREPQPDLFEEQRRAADLASPTGNLFGDVDEDDLDLFTASDMKASMSSGALFHDSATTTPVEPFKGVVKIFEDQDMGGAVKQGEVDSLFLVTDAGARNAPEVEVEDNSELLNIEDDLDALLKVTDLSKTRPGLGAKRVPERPAVAPKPAHLRTGSKTRTPPTGGHPQVTPPGGDCLAGSPEEGPCVGALDASDIIKYIRSSSISAEADLDLFS